MVSRVHKFLAFFSLFCAIGFILGGVTLYVSADKIDDMGDFAASQINSGVNQSFSSEQFKNLPDWAQEKIKAQAMRADPDIMEHDLDLEEMAFPDNKKGCGMRYAFFQMTTDAYREGQSVQELSPYAGFQPLMDDVYASLRAQGVDKAVRQSMKDYAKCVEDAPDASNPSREYDMAIVHIPCSQMSLLMLDTLAAIKRGQSYGDYLQNGRYSHINFEDTSFEGVREPMAFFAAQLFDMSKNTQDDADLSSAAAKMTLGCFM